MGQVELTSISSYAERISCLTLRGRFLEVSLRNFEASKISIKTGLFFLESRQLSCISHQVQLIKDYDGCIKLFEEDHYSSKF